MRIVTMLPMLVCLAGAGLIAAHLIQGRRIDHQKNTEKKAATADKVDQLPAHNESSAGDRGIAERAFASPESMDNSPTAFYAPLSITPHVRGVFDEAWVGNGLAAQNPMQTAEVALTEETPLIADQGGPDGGHTQEDVGPESIAYQQRVDGLMALRQRRLQEAKGN